MLTLGVGLIIVLLVLILLVLVASQVRYDGPHSAVVFVVLIVAAIVWLFS